MSIIIRNADLFWAKLDPKAPVNPFNAPTPHWEIQIRTRSKDEAKTWKDHKLNVTPKEDEEGIFYQVNLKAKAKLRNGDDRRPPQVVDGQLMPLDGTTIGNGSIGNVQLDSYEYTMSGNTGIGFSIKAIQVTKLVEYKSNKGLGFDDEGVTEIVVPVDTDTDDDQW
jgi:hypothetical protein